jgi:hypothetical protein
VARGETDAGGSQLVIRQLPSGLFQRRGSREAEKLLGRMLNTLSYWYQGQHSSQQLLGFSAASPLKQARWQLPDHQLRAASIGLATSHSFDDPVEVVTVLP